MLNRNILKLLYECRLFVLRLFTRGPNCLQKIWYLAILKVSKSLEGQSVGLEYDIYIPCRGVRYVSKKGILDEKSFDAEDQFLVSGSAWSHLIVSPRSALTGNTNSC